jgi:hypothetical protein
MVARRDERTRTPVHAVVRPSPAKRNLSRLTLGALVATVLVGAVAGGLLRAGALPPEILGNVTLTQAAAMLSAFLGTVIGIERAVAVKLGWAWRAAGASLNALALAAFALTVVASAFAWHARARRAG